jgi:hypothetical protein
MFPVGKLASIEKKKNKDGNGKDSRIVTYVLGGRITHWKEREREREREREKPIQNGRSPSVYHSGVSPFRATFLIHQFVPLHILSTRTDICGKEKISYPDRWIPKLNYVWESLFSSEKQIRNGNNGSI